MPIPKIVYAFNDAGNMRVHRIPGYIHSHDCYFAYLRGFFKEEFKEEKKACVIEDAYFKNKDVNFLIKSSPNSDLIWCFYQHALKMRKDLDSLIEKAKAVHFLS